MMKDDLILIFLKFMIAFGISQIVFTQNGGVTGAGIAISLLLTFLVFTAINVMASNDEGDKSDE